MLIKTIFINNLIKLYVIHDAFVLLNEYNYTYSKSFLYERDLFLEICSNLE